jgi:hypothetical protein
VLEDAMKFLLVLAILAGAAWYFYRPLPPGQGPKADEGKRAAGRVVAMLEAYHAAKGVYPVDLDDLIPDYSAGVPTMTNGRPYGYERIGDRFQLTFNYTNPVPVHCTFEPGSKWTCEWF